jgi:hypothetical protein
MGQEIAHQMHAAALPGGMQHPGDCGLQSFMGIGDHQLHAAQATARELAQELGPEGLGLGGTDVHTKDLAPAIAVDADRDDDGDRDDAAGLAHLHIGGVEPDIWPVAFQRAVQEGLHLVVDSPHSRDTWLLEMPDIPMACTRSSTERVEMPWT